MTDTEQREYRQALDNLNRLIGWLEQHGVGTDVAVRSTVADQLPPLHLLPLRDRDLGEVE